MRTAQMPVSGLSEHTISSKLERTTDVISTLFLIVLLSAIMLFPFRFEEPLRIVERLWTALAVFVVAVNLTRWLLSGTVHSLARISIYAVLLMYLFDEIQYFQKLLFDSWLDKELLQAEEFLFGGNLVIGLQQYVHPWLTEGLMFSYVIYMPLLPILGYVVYRSGGTTALNDYLLNISFIFLACFAGYILIPVASPMYYAAHEYTVPLEGGFWTWCGEWLRHNHHYPGGSVPSAHCAAATGMLIMLYRHYRNGYYVALPIFVLLYVATVYGRFHYVSDALAGILTAVVVVRVNPSIVAILHPNSAPHAHGVTSFRPKGLDPKGLWGHSIIPGHDTFLTSDRPFGDRSPS